MTVIDQRPPSAEPAARPEGGPPPGEVATTDRVFRGVLRASGWAVLIVMLLVGLFLSFRALQALQLAGPSFLTTQEWDPDAGAGKFGIAAVLLGTVLVALVAIAFAFPLALGTALFISEYAPRRLKRTMVTLVDLMAAVPSIVFGIWGFLLLQYQVVGVSRWISTYFGWIPIFRVDGAPSSPTDATNFQITVSGPGLIGAPFIQGNTSQSTVGGNINNAFSGPVAQTLAGFATAQGQSGGYLGAGVYTMQLVCRDAVATASLGEFTAYVSVSGSGASSTVSVSDTPPVVAPVNTEAPALTGTAVVPETLTCTDGVWSNSPQSFTYEFLRGATVVQSGTAATYTLTDADAGSSLTCTVTATNTAGSASATSAARAITARAVPANTSVPTLTGTSRVGSVLTCSSGVWTNSPTSYRYSFLRGTTVVQSSTTVRTLTLVPADLGKSVRCTVVATNGGGNSAAAASAARSVTAGAAPVASVKPRVTGTLLVGKKLTASTGTWSPKGTYTYRYSWKRGTAVVGSTSTYVTKAADRGKSITVTVTAIRVGYLTGSATSAAVKIK